MAYLPWTAETGQNRSVQSQLGGMVIRKHSTNASPLCSHGTPRTFITMLTWKFSHCVCVPLSSTMLSATWFHNTRKLSSHCCLSLKSPSPLPVLIFTSYVCLASYITILKFNSLCKMRHSQFLSHRTDGRIKWDNLCNVLGIVSITY